MPDAQPDQKVDALGRILSAFQATRFDWRTVRGLSRELGMDEAIVDSTIAGHPEVFRRSSIAPAGIPLFRPRRRGSPTGV